VTEVAVEDRNRLRTTPAYRRAVRGLQALALAVLAIPATLLLAVFGVPEVVGVAMFAVAFLTAIVGLVLGWSSMLPLERAKRAILTKYQLDAFEMSILMNGMLIRDVVGLRSRSSSDGSEGTA
jgi:hypothetical protein